MVSQLFLSISCSSKYILYFLVDSRHEINIGGECPGLDSFTCVDEPDTQVEEYDNSLRAEETTLYFIIDAYDQEEGSFILSWKIGKTFQTPEF